MSKLILDAEAISRALTRISHEIIEKNKESQLICIIGVRTRGAVLAERIVKEVRKLTNQDIPLGILDINLYRDDLTKVADQPVIHATEISFNLDNRTVVIVDDVLYTGRTVRCALDALIDFGRPKSIQLAVLIDRGHRELPIRADFVGKNVPTSQDEIVRVHLEEPDGKDEVLIEEGRT